MQETLKSYLFFGGRCDEAIAFYADALKSETEMVMRFCDSPDPLPPGMIPEGFDHKIMHATIRIGDCHVLMSDGCGDPAEFKGFRLALNYPSAEEASSVFDALSRGGTIDMPLAPTFWSPLYGMVTDQFGVGWMVMVNAD